MESSWPKGPTRWIQHRILYVSIPFTWDLPEVYSSLRNRSIRWDRVVVGGPAVKLMPEFFTNIPWVSCGDCYPGAMQRVNPLATKTTTGCIRSCGFCAVRKIEGEMSELSDWPDLPVLVDNNLLAAKPAHFYKVIKRLIRHGWADFNQGLDSRLLTQWPPG